MKVVHRANACFSIYHKDYHVLLDPWMNGPAVAQGWAPFPPAKVKIQDIEKPDLVYISHIHSDHCEEETLDHLDRSTPILIMDLAPNFLAKFLKKKDFQNIQMIKEGELVDVIGVKGIKAEPFGASFGHICANVIDSGVIFNIDGKIILNCNDNKPSKELSHYLKEKYGEIDLAFIPGGGGSGYPAMYDNLTQKEKEEIVEKNITNYKKVFVEAIDILKPKLTIPVAGGFAIRGPVSPIANWLQNRSLNHHEIINFYKENSSFKNSRIRPVQPGIEIDLNTLDYIGDGYRPWSKEQLAEYFEELGRVKIEPKVKVDGEAPALPNLLKIATQNLNKHQERLGMRPDYRIILDIQDIKRSFQLNLLDGGIEELTNTQFKEPYLKVLLEQDTLLEWLLGYEDFNMLDSGHRLRFFRKPNDYVVEAYYLMSLFRI